MQKNAEKSDFFRVFGDKKWILLIHSSHPFFPSILPSVPFVQSMVPSVPFVPSKAVPWKKFPIFPKFPNLPNLPKILISPAHPKKPCDL